MMISGDLSDVETCQLTSLWKKLACRLEDMSFKDQKAVYVYEVFTTYGLTDY